MSSSQEGPTEQFTKMSQPERQAYVQSIPMSQKQMPNIIKGHSFIEQDIMKFQGTQQGQTINLKTYRYPSAKEQVKGVVIMLHSYYAHSQYFSHTAKRLSQEGYISLAYDMRGAGKSQGERGQWNDYKAIIQETYRFIKQGIKMYPKLPMFVLGWGIAALNVLHISLYHYNQFNFAGIIMASTFFRTPSNTKHFDVVGSVAEGALNIAPAKVGIYKPNYDCFTRYKTVSKALEDDPLNAHCMTNARTVMQFNDLLLDLPQQLWDKIDTPPIVVLHGMKDKYGSGYHAYHFYNKIKSVDKELWYYKELNFAFMLEQEYPEIEEKLVDWLNKKTEKFNGGNKE